MTVNITTSVATTPDGLGSWQTISDPATGADWSATVPTGKAWRVWGGGCKIVTTSTAGTRVPGLFITDGATTTVFAYSNTQNGSSSGPGANSTAWVCYYEMADLQPTHFSQLPYPVPVRAIWLPAGFVITGHFDGLQAGDQVSDVGLLVEEAAV